MRYFRSHKGCVKGVLNKKLSCNMPKIIYVGGDGHCCHRLSLNLEYSFLFLFMHAMLGTIQFVSFSFAELQQSRGKQRRLLSSLRCASITLVQSIYYRTSHWLCSDVTSHVTSDVISHVISHSPSHHNDVFIFVLLGTNIGRQTATRIHEPQA